MLDGRILTHPDPRGFDATTTWVFDLDNTLYPSSCNLFAQIHEKMGHYIVKKLKVAPDEAQRIQRRYYIEHGTTLAGLMKHDGIDPQSFLDHVHDIDYTPVAHAPDLAAALAALPGRRLIYTNGSRGHAHRVCERLGVLHLIEDIFDITDAAYLPKPAAAAYDRFLASHGVDGTTAAMFEDLPQNLNAASALGMTTVLVHSTPDDHPIYREMKSWQRLPDHVHHVTEDLAEFLGALAAPKRV
jgi:putative hydrolase of the HAD superfamily